MNVQDAIQMLERELEAGQQQCAAIEAALIPLRRLNGGAEPESPRWKSTRASVRKPKTGRRGKRTNERTNERTNAKRAPTEPP